MPTTPNGLSYPDSSAHTRLWDHLHDAAVSVDARYGLSVANVAALAAIPTPFAGMRVWVADVKEHAVYDGAKWCGVWTAYTPVVTNLTTIGNGLIVARYRLADSKTLDYRFTMTGGSTSAGSGGALSVRLPSGMAGHASGGQTVHFRYWNGTTLAIGGAYLPPGATDINLSTPANPSGVTGITTGYEFNLSGLIELA